jgi:hypothetical protein
MNNFVKLSYRQLNKLQLRSVLSLGASYTLPLFHGDMFINFPSFLSRS